MPTAFHYFIGIFGGMLLAVMVQLNGQIAAYSSPLFSSWVAHVIGAIVALLLVYLIRRWPDKQTEPVFAGPPPWWSYLGGVPGAILVALAGITVNSSIGLTGTLAFSIVGQLVFGSVSDQFGWFGLPKFRLTPRKLLSVLLVLAGSLLIIFAEDIA